MTRNHMIEVEQTSERALLVGVDLGTHTWSLEDSMTELARLAQTAGATVIGSVTQRLDTPSPRSYIGSGKAAEIAYMCKDEHIDVVIFDSELSPSQQSNLEAIFGHDVKVIDRCALILDIFAAHAKSHEGRVQVQLAQLNYLLPRLRGMWAHLVSEQTRGGIGSRFGQGESQLEVDRRLVRKRIARLSKELKQLEGRRALQRKARWDSSIFRVALVGYTNAGKSTLLNHLTGSDVYVRDELFATLDPTTRALSLEHGMRITLTDTVGFIQKLPTLVVESFKSTLAEASNADLLLKVVDASDANAQLELDAVQDVLAEIGAGELASMVVFNKCDLVDAERIASLRDRYPDAVFISALTGFGIESLLHSIVSCAIEANELISMLIPYDKAKLLKQLHESCHIIREHYQDNGIFITARVPQHLAELVRNYKVDDTTDPSAYG